MLGIDIDAGYIKMVMKDKQNQLVQWVKEPVSPGLIQDGAISSEEALALLIRKILKSAGIRVKKCGICISSNQFVVRELYFPAMIKDSLEDNIRYEIAEYLPLGIDNYVLGYRILDYEVSSQNNLIRVMAVAAPKDMVESYIRVFKKAGLKPVILDIPANCQEIWYNTYISKIEDLSVNHDNVCLIYMGAFTTRYTLLHKGIYFIDKISTTIGSMNQGINIDLLVEEIMEILNFYYLRNPGHEIQKILLMMDGEHNAILAKQIERHLGIEVYSIKTPIDDQGRICLPNAIGAVVNYEKYGNKRLNLIEAKKKGKQRLYRFLTVLSALLLIVVIGIKGFWIPIRNKNRIVNEINMLEAKKADYEGLISSYQEMRDEIEYLKNMKMRLDEIISKQSNISYYFELIDNCLPPNVYIIEFSTDNDSIKLLGSADDDKAIAQFLIKLASTGEFEKVFINEISLEERIGFRIFRLQCNVNIYNDQNNKNSSTEGES